MQIYNSIGTELKSPTADVQKAAASVAEQTLVNQSKMLKVRAEKYADETTTIVQESDRLQKAAATIPLQDTDKGWHDVRSFMQENFRQHAESVQDLKQHTEQLHETSKLVLNDHTETLKKVLDGLESINPLIEEMQRGLFETKQAVEDIKTEQNHIKTLVNMQPELMEMMRQMRQEMKENHEREPGWFTEFKNMQKQ